MRDFSEVEMIGLFLVATNARLQMRDFSEVERCCSRLALYLIIREED